MSQNNLSIIMTSLQQGKVDEAENLCQALIREDANNVDAHTMMGLIALQSSRAALAVEHFSKAVQAQPENPNAHTNLAQAYMVTQQIQQAVHHANLALKLDPNNLKACQMLAQIYKAANQPQEAALFMERVGFLLLQMAQTDPAKLAEAEQALLESIALHTGYHTAFYNLAMVQHELGKFDSCLINLGKAHEMAPDNLQYMFQTASIHSHYGNTFEAIDLFKQVLKQDPHHIDTLIELANAYDQKGQLANALDHYNKALALQPEHVQALALKAMTCERMNLLDEAQALAEKVQTLAPDSERPLMTLARIARRNKEFEKAETYIRQINGVELEPSIVYSELGQILDKQKRYDEAFEAFETAQKHSREHPSVTQTDKQYAPQMIQSSQRFFTKERVAGWQDVHFDDGLPSPSFLVGFPRSGTTLLEQILGSHPNIVATDEANLLNTLIEHDIKGSNLIYPNALAELSNADISELRQRYWNYAKAVVDDDCINQHLLDKQPLDLIHLGLIQRLFPQARIIIALRDARDAVLSSFMQHFTVNPYMVHLQSLEGAAQFYADSMGLLRHYQQTLSLAMFEHSYEAMLDDLEGGAKRAIEFLGEAWNDSLLDYHNKDNNRFVATPSYEGVQQPIYKSAQARWKNYESHIQPIVPILQPFLEPSDN